MKLKFDVIPVFKYLDPFQGETFETLKRSLLAIMIRQKDQVFKKQSDPDGNAWKPLSPLVADAKNKKSKKTDAQIAKLREKNPNFSQHKILIDTGTLMKSLATPAGNSHVSSTTGTEIVLGSNLPYAAIQNFGGKIEKKNGSGFIVIPARPFIGFGGPDKKQIQEKIQATAKKVQVVK